MQKIEHADAPRPSRRGFLFYASAPAAAVAAHQAGLVSVLSSVPDAALIALAAEHPRAVHAHNISPDEGAEEAETFNRVIAIEAELSATPARSLDGIQAKARVLARLFGNLDEPDDDQGNLARSICRDLLAMGGTA